MTLPEGYLTPEQRQALDLNEKEPQTLEYWKLLLAHADACDQILAERDREIKELKGALENESENVRVARTDAIWEADRAENALAELGSATNRENALKSKLRGITTVSDFAGELLKECATLIDQLVGMQVWHSEICACHVCCARKLLAKLQAAGISTIRPK